LTYAQNPSTLEIWCPGKTVLINLTDALYVPLFNPAAIENYFLSAVKLCDQHTAPNTYKCHKFPNGLTATIILLESHFAIHTWPEDGCTRIEMSTCRPPAEDTLVSLRRLTEKTFGGKVDMTTQDWR